MFTYSFVQKTDNFLVIKKFNRKKAAVVLKKM